MKKTVIFVSAAFILSFGSFSLATVPAKLTCQYVMNNGFSKAQETGTFELTSEPFRIVAKSDGAQYVISALELGCLVPTQPSLGGATLIVDDKSTSGGFLTTLWFQLVQTVGTREFKTDAGFLQFNKSGRGTFKCLGSASLLSDVIELSNCTAP